MTSTDRPKMTATTATQRALLCLHDSGYGGVSAGEVGASAWPERECRPGRGVSVNGGGDYAAQMLLGRLKKAGLVEYAPSEGSSRWRLSTKGRNEVRRMHAAPIAKEAKVPKRPPESGGAIVTNTDPCVCGGAPEDHGRDPAYPGSTACTHCTDCIAYEADPEAP
jgi:hypothetical protein